MNARTRFCPVLIAIKIGAAVLLILGLFVLGVFPDQPAPPVQGMVGLPVLSTPVVPPPVSANGGGGFSGTLASFTALIPENLAVYLPLINQ